MKKVRAWWIAGAMVLLVFFVLLFSSLRDKKPLPGAGAGQGQKLPGLVTTTTLLQPYPVAAKPENREDPDAFPGAAALIRKTKPRVVARLGKYDDYEDLGHQHGIRFEKYIYYEKLYGVRELVIHFENGLSRKLDAHFLEYRDFSVEDAFSAIGIPFPSRSALRQERYTADKRYYYWENYSGYKKIEIAAQKDGDQYHLLYISVEK
jgi:hypothetical protein